MRNKTLKLVALILVLLGMLIPQAATAQAELRIDLASVQKYLQKTPATSADGYSSPEVFKYASQIAAAAKDEIWPGFDVLKYASLESAAGPIRFSSDPDNPSRQVFWTVGNDWFLKNSLEDGIAIIFHEAFHGFERDQKREGARWRAENALLVVNYVETSARNNALFNIEGRILFSALKAKDRGALKKRALEFMAVRQLRQRELDPRFVEFEKGAESNEGLAEYAGARAVLAGINATVRKRVNIPFQSLDAREYIGKKFQRLNSINDAGRNVRLKFYYTGSAQAFLLDRLMPGWKKRVQSKGEALQDLIEEAAGTSSAQAQTIADAALREYGYEGILKAEEAAIARRKAEAQAALDSVLNQKGRRYVLDVSAFGKMGDLRGFDPMNVIVVNKERHVQMRMLNVAEEGSYKASFMQPVVEDFENKQYVTVSQPEEEQMVSVDGAPLDTSKPGETRFEKKLLINTPRFSLEANKGTVAVTEKGILVRLEK